MGRGSTDFGRYFLVLYEYLPRMTPPHWVQSGGIDMVIPLYSYLLVSVESLHSWQRSMVATAFAFPRMIGCLIPPSIGLHR